MFCKVLFFYEFPLLPNATHYGTVYIVILQLNRAHNICYIPCTVLWVQFVKSQYIMAKIDERMKLCFIRKHYEN